MALVGWNLFKHPEEGKGEVFLGNSSMDEFPHPKFAALKTMRMGTRTFDINGNEITPEVRVRPVFIAEHEQPLYESIMTRGRCN